MQLKVLLRKSTLVKNSFPPKGLGKSIWIPVWDVLVTSNTCRCLWNAEALPQSSEYQNQSKAPRSGFLSVLHVIWRALQESGRHDSHTFETYWAPLMHWALLSGQGYRNGQDKVIILKRVHSLTESRQGSQYYGVSHCWAMWQAA